MPINYDDYPPNWKSEIRPRILKRAAGKCEQCKVPNYMWILRGHYDGQEVYQDMDGNIYDATNSKCIGDDYVGEVAENPDKPFIQVKLTIAHLDHDPENWDVKDERLMALCQQCHLRLDTPIRQVKRRKNKYHDSMFPWGSIPDDEFMV